MKVLIVGLGNPGDQYAGTRHNIGFAFMDYLEKHDPPAGKAGYPASWKLERAETYMNQSGIAVKKFVKKHGVKPDRLVVIHDDLDIEFGKFKVAFARNSAGHRGVQNIIDQLTTNKFWRLRLGTANAKLKKMRAAGTVADFVLAKFTPTESSGLPAIFKAALHGLSDQLDHA